MENRNRKNWVLNRHVNVFLQDVLNGIRVVKAFGNEKREIGKFNNKTDRFASWSEKTAILYDTVFPILGFAIRFGSYLILF